VRSSCRGGGALMSNSLVQVDCMVVPLDMLACNGTCTTHVCMHGAVADKKMLVEPVSSIAVSFIDADHVVGVQSKVKVNLSNC
jgi:hypothetical protein